MTEPDLETGLQRPRAMPAFLTSVGVLGFLLAQAVAYRLIRVAREAQYDVGDFGAESGYAWLTDLVVALGIPLCFALGLFLCLWQVAPITGGLRLAQVATRAVLATSIGAACVGVFRFFGGLIYVATTPELRALPDPLGGVAFDAMMDSLGDLIGLLPLVLLAGVVLWGWLRWRRVPEPSADSVATLNG